MRVFDYENGPRTLLTPAIVFRMLTSTDVRPHFMKCGRRQSLASEFRAKPVVAFHEQQRRPREARVPHHELDIAEPQRRGRQDHPLVRDVRDEVMRRRLQAQPVEVGLQPRRECGLEVPGDAHIT